MAKTFILSPKTIPDVRKFHDLIKSQVPDFDGFVIDGSTYTVILNVSVTQELIDQIEAIVPPPALTMEEQIRLIVKNAIDFGNKLITDFATENVMMGITQDGMTKTVRTNLSDLTNCLMTGSLYDAINEIKLIPAEKKDNKYITDARLLVFLNKIEAYLGIPLSNSL